MSFSLTARPFARHTELILVLGSTVLVTLAGAYFDFFEQLTAFVEVHDHFQLDEMLLGLIYLCAVSVIVIFRRDRALRREIGRRETSEELATQLARHDPLTGLANRRILSEVLDATIDSLDPHELECAVFMIDLDLFKPVNDLHGHRVGDAVLVEVAARLSAIVGPAGTVARMGGDEFACVVSHPPGSDLPTRLATQILRVLGEPIFAQGLKVQIGSTIGIALAPQDGMKASALLHGADLAMYKGKREGRGVYHFFDEAMDLALRERAALEDDLRLAVSAGEIIPHFQPLMDLATDRILGFEALARWMHPTKGMIPPDTFIPIAEDLGIIDEITYAMLRAACSAAADWPASLSLSVNVSPVQLKDPWLASRLLAILAEMRFAPDRLIIEVTENAVIDDMKKAQEIFSALQSVGVRIALDDFGKGYSSLYHLRELRFDQLKIDRSFVHSMECPESAKIVSAVTGLGKSLGMPVTAEGVETNAEAIALRALGCEHAQGFLFGEPLDADATLALLAHTAALRIRRLRSA
jgi:diguanylate cyclase (GGDEF)-like protein